MKHQHIYDDNGKQLCCTLEEKINSKINSQAVYSSSKKEHEHEHSEGDGHDHDHSNDNQTTFRMFLPATISFLLLLIAIYFDNFSNLA